MSESRYLKYSDAMNRRFGKKVYKIPINLPVTCPNRDGTVSVGGCTFCGAVGTGFESMDSAISVAEQFEATSAYIAKKYKAEGFIAFLQNFSNTYMPLDQFQSYLDAVESLSVLGISISTRPDCIAPIYLEMLKTYSDRNGWHVTMEYGLQTVNYHTLDRFNRGHGLAEFIEAIQMTREFEFETCAHLILNLPWDDARDCEEAAAILNALRVDQVKLHGLYLLKNTAMGEAFANGEFTMISAEEYVDRVVSFIRQARPEMVFQRLTGRAPEEETLFCNWGMSWWRISDGIESRLEALDAHQGDCYTRTASRAVKLWL